MAITLKSWQYFELMDDGGNIVSTLGTPFRDRPKTLEGASEVIYDATIAAATATATKLFDIDDAIATDFDALLIQPIDTAVEICLVTDSNNVADDQWTYINLTADMVFMLTNDLSRKNDAAVIAFDGTTANINQVYAYQSSGATVNVRVLAIT